MEHQIIKSNTVNFKELVSKETTLSFKIQTKLVAKLDESFSDEEQRWYIANLYMYMNYHPTDDYPINLEHVFKLIGFAHKENAKRTLKNNFVEGEDYKKLLVRTDGQVHNGRNLGGAGMNKEDIMLNIDTFKNLCMLAKTENGKKIRKYYVKLEGIYNKLVKEELEQKLLEMSSTHQLEKHNLFIESYDKRPVVYIGYIGNGKYKYGKTKRLKTRVDEHKSTYGDKFVLVHVVECEYNKELETRLQRSSGVSQRLVTFVDSIGDTHIEIVQLDDDFKLEDLINTLEYLKKEVVDYFEKKNEQITVQVENLTKDFSEWKSVAETMKMTVQHISSLVPALTQIASTPQVTQALQEILPVETNENTTVEPLPVIPKQIDDIKIFYNQWKTNMKPVYEAHVNKHLSPQWSKCFGANEGKVIGKRWHCVKDFLEFLDKSSDADMLLNVFENFCTERNIPHNAFIKRCFYGALRPNTSYYTETQYKTHIQEFIKKMSDAGFSLPS